MKLQAVCIWFSLDEQQVCFPACLPPTFLSLKCNHLCTWLGLLRAHHSTKPCPHPPQPNKRCLKKKLVDLIFLVKLYCTE